jgi:hypothetical protein
MNYLSVLLFVFVSVCFICVLFSPLLLASVRYADVVMGYLALDSEG